MYIIFMACIYVINALLILSKYINACVGMLINTANVIVHIHDKHQDVSFDT